LPKSRLIPRVEKLTAAFLGWHGPTAMLHVSTRCILPTDYVSHDVLRLLDAWSGGFPTIVGSLRDLPFNFMHV
jgi:hypothetical protein